MKNIYKIILFFFTIPFLFAQQGILDTSFGVNGIQKTSKLMYYNGDGNPRGTVKVLFSSTGNAIYLGNDLVNGGILPVINSTNNVQNSNTVWNNKTVVRDGIIGLNNKIYATGYTQKNDNNKAIFIATAVNNYDISGGVAPNYDGKIIFDTKETDEEGVAIKEQSDGKIVVLGYSGTSGIVIRYNADGYLDRTFNQKGFHTFQIAQNTKPKALAIQQDGKIIVAGNCFNGSDTDSFITRLNANGSFDSTFGNNGIVIKDINNHDNTANAMILANDGSIYIGGKAYTTGGDFGLENQFSDNFAVLKFNQTGILDTTVSNGILPGAFIKSLSTYLYTSPPTIIPNDEEVQCMAYDDINERIYIYGYVYKKLYDNQYNIITKKSGLWNYCISLNSSFTYENSTNFQFPTNYADFETEIISATIKTSDKILGSGTTKVYAVVKFNNCTTGESTFVSIPSTNSNTFPLACNNNAIAINFEKIEKYNNDYYALTNVNFSYQTGVTKGHLYKLDANFNVISDFGINGKIINVRDFRIDYDGKIICTMNSVSNTGFKTLLSRFTSNGDLDYTFGNFGEVRSQNLINTFGIHVTLDNTYIITSYRVTPQARIIVEKFTNNGDKDESFGSPELLNIANYSTYPSLKSSVEILSDDLENVFTIAYLQNVYNISDQIINLSKVGDLGNLDTSFGSNGIVNLIPFFIEPTNLLNLVKLNNGKLLVYSNKRMVQINPDGTIDLSFGINGTKDSETMVEGFIISKVLTDGNNYFIGGYKTNGGGNSTIIKMNGSGIIDTNFATNGIYVDLDSNYLNVSQNLRNMYFDTINKIVFYGGGMLIKRIQ